MTLEDLYRWLQTKPNQSVRPARKDLRELTIAAFIQLAKASGDEEELAKWQKL